MAAIVPVRQVPWFLQQQKNKSLDSFIHWYEIDYITKVYKPVWSFSTLLYSVIYIHIPDTGKFEFKTNILLFAERKRERSIYASIFSYYSTKEHNYDYLDMQLVISNCVSNSFFPPLLCNTRVIASWSPF